MPEWRGGIDPLAFSSDPKVDALLHGLGDAHRTLPDLLEAVMRAVAAQVAPRGGSIRLRGHGTLVIGHHGGQTVSDWLSESPEPAAQSIDALVATQIAGIHPTESASTAGEQAYAIAYAGQPLGELRLDLPSPPPPGGAVDGLIRQVAANLGPLVKRYEVRRWSEARLGCPMMLVGMSRPLRTLERFLEIATRGDLPVLLRGEFGTEKAQLAATLHCCGARGDGPFVQINCAEPDGGPGAWVDRAAGGTLYLDDIDALDPKLQRQLPQYLPSRLGQWLDRRGDRSVRVIASTTADLHARAAEGRFSRALLAELDYLSATIPPLRERAADIAALIGHVLERNGYRAEDKRTDALVSLCQAHDWPENLFELDRTIARLAVMTEGRPIDRRAVRDHAPGLVADDDPDPPRYGDDGDDEAPAADAARWVRAALGDGSGTQGLHDALARALSHLGRHFADPLSIGQLAWAAGVSPSHLSFLFRSGIGMPFKTLLAHIRIHKACELLGGDHRRPVTDVALSVGFADLSHFERSFRRIVGQPPRAFRRAQVGG